MAYENSFFENMMKGLKRRSDFKSPEIQSFVKHLEQIKQLDVGDPTELINYTMKTKLGNPYEILNNKNMSPDYIDQILNDISTFKEDSKDFYNKLYNTGTSGLSENNLDLVINNLNQYGEDEIKLYRQQSQALKNRQKYKDKDIMDKVEAYKLIEESERIKDTVEEKSRIESETSSDIDLDELNKQWYENKQKEFAERELEIQKEFSDVNTLKPEDIMGETVEETLENAAETVINNTAGEVVEETVEKIIKETTGINTELNIPKKRTPKKLKKGTGKYRNKTGKQVYENSRYWDFDYNDGDDIYIHGTKKGTSRFDKKDLYKNDTNTNTSTNSYADDIKKRLKEIDSWSDDYIRSLSEEDIINYSDNGEVFEKLYGRWNELNSSTNTSTSGDNKQKIKNAMDDYKTQQDIEELLSYENQKNFYNKFDIDPETGKPNFHNTNWRNLDEAGYNVPNIEGIDADGKLIKGDTRQVRPDVDMPNGTPGKTGIIKYLDDFKNMSFIEKAMTLGNVAGAVSDYKNARREGHGVVSSAIRAGTEFALGEALGMYYPLYLLAKEAPGLVIKGTEMLYKENRKMNSAANQQIFGGAQFQDTQQLATMRQSG